MTSSILSAPLAAQAHALSKKGDWNGAAEKLKTLISELTESDVIQLSINRDQYSLNSLNGFVSLSNGREYFFKYHHEEGEEHSIEEYYRAELLKEHGFPVDVPVFACKEPGRQILLYNKRNDSRLADVCREIESGHNPDLLFSVVDAQIEFDKLTLSKTLQSYKTATAEQVGAEAIHQLFYRRLTDGKNPDGFGGRVNTFYVNKRFQLGNVILDWETFSHAKWQINGDLFPLSIHELFTLSAKKLQPEHLARHGVVTAHGDAHNANVWYEDGEKAILSLFDPAFAGEYIPALLAEIKATFHNIYAHPYWLYEPSLAEQQYEVTAQYDPESNRIIVTHNWQLSRLRGLFLESKVTHYWKPLITFLQRKNVLPSDWKEIIRMGLFCCPTLVMDLRANGLSSHTTHSSPLGFAIAVSLANSSESSLSNWLDKISISQDEKNE
ncbi:hypothetical protein [Vibrio salinus]|uniref:hypothetical protein n=1 Tax=Vibrio salinus TaxID=2899784 RepID=UPI001E5F9279|nr:hypothetical protein [Vibrio salinus]MCE0492785.1 hypothetical protein [Vibrio salinus]